MSVRAVGSAVALALFVGSVSYFVVGWATGSETRETVADDGLPPGPAPLPSVIPEGLTPGPTPEAAFPTDWNYEVHDALAEDAAKPLFDGDLAGIHLEGDGDEARPDPAACPEPGEYSNDMTLAAGTPFDIMSEGLPSGISDLELPSVSLCQGEVVGTGRTLLVDGEYVVYVIRLLRAAPWSDSYGPPDRTYESEIDGVRVVVVGPVLPSGIGDPVVIAAAETEGGFVLTWVGHADIPLDRLLQVAEEVLK